VLERSCIDEGCWDARRGSASLRHLSARSVRFATVTNISVSADTRSSVRVLSFLWTPDEPVATLRLGFKRIVVKTDSMYNQLKRSDDFGSSPQEALEKSRVMLQNDSFIEVGLYRKKFLPVCRQLRFIRYVKLENCSARVHQRLDIKGHFLIEPLLCHNISSLSSESVRYDYSRDMHYLKLDLVLQDEATRDAVRTQLADLSPRSVDFMRLWTAERSVSSSLSARFEVGLLMASADWRSAQLRLLCGTFTKCRDLRSAVLTEPADLWRHVQWRWTSLVAEQMKASEGAVSCSSLKSCVRLHSASAPRTAAFQILPDGRCFVKFQQRLTGRGGATLRVEMKLWNGSELHAEYAGFQVGDASTGYRMTYREMLRDRLNVSYVALENSKGMRFSTMDRDNDSQPAASSSSQQHQPEQQPASTSSQPEQHQQSTSQSSTSQSSTSQSSSKQPEQHQPEQHQPEQQQPARAAARAAQQSSTSQQFGSTGRLRDASTGYRMTYREMLTDRSSVSWDALELSKDMRFSTMDRDN
uniref:Fibrinogen C-terminal domain-containing protein n=1 Tax=Macrostomum lignano TaxID=282301 RepID=A0A1I8JHU1_9PLAT